jgi:hypothetical protein
VLVLDARRCLEAESNPEVAKEPDRQIGLREQHRPQTNQPASAAEYGPAAPAACGGVATSPRPRRTRPVRQNRSTALLASPASRPRWRFELPTPELPPSTRSVERCGILGLGARRRSAADDAIRDSLLRFRALFPGLILLRLVQLVLLRLVRVHLRSLVSLGESPSPVRKLTVVLNRPEILRR